ncbi:CBU_0592 family membrane protein [Nonlabens marinus]|uniref:CBU-0592-like domain-containing protein n=1 Tax=Nonlabens marinus S1-08 TaxID=1454201 RepID=W8VXP9_9FLAO|nr:hypothetical protein [Nonlabens marinus]BAO56307.1 hypothetical protein NMS_2298 [Nonlabens marinus S1-08]
MNLTDWIGAVGVFLILLAYFLNVIGRVKTVSLTFILLNLVGASLACAASILLRYWPFILLEACWSLISLGSLIKFILKPKEI